MKRTNAGREVFGYRIPGSTMFAPTVTMDKINPKFLGDSGFLQIFLGLFQVIMANPLFQGLFFSLHKKGGISYYSEDGPPLSKKFDQPHV